MRTDSDCHIRGFPKLTYAHGLSAGFVVGPVAGGVVADGGVIPHEAESRVAGDVGVGPNGIEGVCDWAAVVRVGDGGVGDGEAKTGD